MYSYTVCYVVSDDETLSFYTELLISLSSLRKQRFDGPVIILTDEMTAAEIERQDRVDYKELLAELRVVDVPSSYSQKEKSRFLKTSMRKYIAGSFFYLDTDTVFAGQLPDNFDEELALALDFNTELKNQPDYSIRFVSELNKSGGYTLDVDRPYYNSGCIWSRDSALAHEFFRRWNEEWQLCRERGFVLDQPALNHINLVMGGVIQELDGKYNVQVAGAPTPINLLNDAIIIHYYNGKLKQYMLQKPEIKSMGYQSEVVQEIISFPKSAFLPCVLISLEEKQRMEDLKFLKGTSILSALKRLHKKHRLLFRLLNDSCRLLRKLFLKHTSQ